MEVGPREGRLLLRFVSFFLFFELVCLVAIRRIMLIRCGGARISRSRGKALRAAWTRVEARRVGGGGRVILLRIR